MPNICLNEPSYIPGVNGRCNPGVAHGMGLLEKQSKQSNLYEARMVAGMMVRKSKGGLCV